MTESVHTVDRLEVWQRSDGQQAKALVVCCCGTRLTSDLIEGGGSYLRARMDAEQAWRTHRDEALMNQGLFGEQP